MLDSERPRINVEPFGFAPVPIREDTTQAIVRDALMVGVTFEELRALCITRKGKPWSDKAIQSLLYHDLRNKGYGVRSIQDYDRGLIYKLVIPDAA